MKLIAFLVAWLVSASAFAQDGQVRETIPAAPYLAGAYGFIWAAVLVYVVLVARRLARVTKEIEDLRRRLDQGT